MKRAFSPTDSATADRNETTSCFLTFSISSIRLMSTVAREISRIASGGISPAAARARHTANLDVEPQFEFMLFGPYLAHLGEGVSC